MKYCGIDLHGNNNWLVIIDEKDRVLYSRRHANDLSTRCSISLLSSRNAAWKNDVGEGSPTYWL